MGMAVLADPAMPRPASAPRQAPPLEPIEGLVFAAFTVALLAITLLQGSIADRTGAFRDIAVCHPRSFPSGTAFFLAFH